MLNIRAWIHCENMIDLLDPRVDMDRILNRILKVSFSFLKIKRKIKQMLNFLLNRNCHVYKHELTVLIHHCITISWKASLCLSFCCVQCACRFSHTWPPVSYPLLICPSLSWKGDSCGRFMFIRHTVTAP